MVVLGPTGVDKLMRLATHPQVPRGPGSHQDTGTVLERGVTRADSAQYPLGCLLGFHMPTFSCKMPL